MKNGYELLTYLTTTLNNNETIINEITKNGKDEFSKNDNHINVGIGIINEINEIILSLDEEVLLFNKKLNDLLSPIINFSRNLFNDYNIVNSYKLYDALKHDVKELKLFLNFIGEKNV